ncbi:MAG: thermonuclease family protein [Alphaproteobacteria bacterium]|nr:thermonuclease family protein [Alphaproteobacteria bacterium]
MSKIYTSYKNLIILLALILLSIIPTCTAKEITSSPLAPIKVIDGDSLEIGTQRIRLMGIDAPEYVQQCKNQNKKKYACGIKSADYLKEMIGDGPITCKIIKKDQYERNLCTCYKGKINLNREMVKNGYAITYMESPYKKEQQEAQQNKRGIWSGRFMQPRLFRRLKEQQKLN